MQSLSYWIYTLFLCYAVTFTSLASAVQIENEYPKTLQERRADEMGSVLDGGGVSFSRKKVKNESTKALVGSVNKYLWESTIEILDFAPLSSTDSSSGIIITDWYSPSAEPKDNWKINVRIKDIVISPEALEIKVFTRKLVNNRWVESKKNLAEQDILVDKILRRARELYINDTIKRKK